MTQHHVGLSEPMNDHAAIVHAVSNLQLQLQDATRCHDIELFTLQYKPEVYFSTMTKQMT